MLPIVVCAVVTMAASAASAAAGPAIFGTIVCYDSKGEALVPFPAADPLDCKLWCPEGCPDGGCIRHNRCDCGTGYQDARTPNQVTAKEPVRCEPICTNQCVNADCVSPDQCKCWDQYMFLPGNSTTCFWGD